MVQKYNVAIIPPEAVRERAIEMSEWIAAEGSRFVLDDENPYPHISLYHVALDVDRVPLVITALTAGLESVRPFFLRQGPYRAVEDEWIDVSYDRYEDVMRLHTAVIEAVGDLRANQGTEKDREDFASLSENQRGSLLRTGWTEAFERYVPHLTFSRLNKKDAGIISKLPFEDFGFYVDRIGLYEMGEHGTCTRLVHEFSLKELSSEAENK
ncbi:MAG: 2'-5' RNA ligase family protein [Undibacterium sp.]